MALSMANDDLRTIADRLKDVVYRFRISPSPALEYVNPAITAITGHTPEEHYKDPYLGAELIHPGDRRLIEALLHMKPGSAAGPLVVRWKRRDGTVIWTESNHTPVFDSSGALVAIEGIARDITGRIPAGERAGQAVRDNEDIRRSLEQALLESEAKYHDLFENAGDAIFLLDSELRYVDVNRKALELLGCTRGEILGRQPYDFMPEEQKPSSEAEFEKLKREGSYETFIGRMKTRDGRFIDIEVSSTAIFKDGVFAGSRDIIREISERRKAEKKLKESERRLKEAQKIAHIGDWKWDVATNLVYWSDELYRIYGYEPHAIQPDYGLVLEAMHPESKLEFLAAIDAALKGERPFEMDYAFFRKDGSVAVLHTIGRVLRDERGRPVWMTGTVQDITEQKKAEQALKESEEKFRTIFDNANDGILITDIETRRFVAGNAAICAMLGCTKDDITRLGIDEIHPRETMPFVLSEFESQMRGEKTVAQDLPVMRKDGSVFYADIGSAVVSFSGKRYAVGIFHDTTARRRSEEERKRLISAFTESSDGIAIADKDHRYIYVNNAHAAIYGYTPDELIGKTWRLLVPPGLLETAEEGVASTLLNRDIGVLHSEMLSLKKDGSLIPTEVRAKALFDRDGSYEGHVCVVTDITERKEAESALRRSEEFIKNILNSVDESFLVIAPDYRIITANSAYCRSLGRTREEIMGRFCYELSHKAGGPCHENGEDCAVRRSFDSGVPCTAVHRHAGMGDAIEYVETKAFPLKDASGKVTSVIETLNNITEKYLLEEQRLKTQKLEAIGTLAGGIAHDFNNLLQSVFGYISLAKLSLGTEGKASEMLRQAEKALGFTVSLTNQLLTFSKGGKPVKKRMALHAMIENAVKFGLSGSRAECAIDIEERLWPVEVDEGQIAQVIQNVVLNASEAMPEGGTVTVTARNVAAARGSRPSGESVAPRPFENYVEISVRDTGVGIPGQYLSKIFDPYFTTKQRGSGLGLATSFSIIRNHGGSIDVDSALNRGTSFFIKLPAAESIEDEPASAPSPATGRLGKVLVMDDDETVRAVAKHMLLNLGHKFSVAEHGEEAEAQYIKAIESKEPFDVVILDLTVRGGRGGEETLRRLRDIDPSVRAIVSSGYSDTEAVSNYAACGFKARLTKPYVIDTLRDVLNLVLA